MTRPPKIERRPRDVKATDLGVTRAPRSGGAIRATLQEQLSLGLLLVPRVRRKFAAYLIVLATVAFTCSMIGTWGTRNESFPRSLEDTISLFPSGFPDHSANKKGAWVLIAMYAAALLSLSITGRILWAFFARQRRQMQASRRRGHVVVCGLGEKGLRCATAYLAETPKRKVTCIDLDATSDRAVELRERGAIVLEGDATQKHVLTTAAAHHAGVVVCACTDDSANTTIAAQLEKLVAERGSRWVDVYVHISNPDLSGILGAPTFAVEAVRLNFFNIFELWAYRLVAAAELEQLAATSQRPRVVVAGSTSLARLVVVHFARTWYELCPDPARRPTITLLAEDATAQKVALERRYPALARTAELRPVDYAVSSANPIDIGSLESPTPESETTIYLCLHDDGDNLNLALQAQHRVADTRIVVPASAWTAELQSLLDRAEGGIRTVGYTSNPGSLDLLEDSRRELMAREVHASYIAGADSSLEARVDWDELPDNLRESNRQQVAHMDDHLRALWFEIVPLDEWDRAAADLTPADVEALAELEHLRWCAEKRRDRYELGETRSDTTPRTHPDLRPWRELSDIAADKDRRAVRAWPGILSRAGYGLRRLPDREVLAELIHERHRRDRIAAGESESGNPLLRPWSELSDSERELSRSSADGIAVKLHSIGCRIVPQNMLGAPFRFDDQELEELAEREHERWCAERLAEGWRYGPGKDAGRRQHPDLVPWPDLPEPRRQIDRDHVAAIPELLSGIGCGIARRAPD